MKNAITRLTLSAIVLGTVVTSFDSCKSSKKPTGKPIEQVTGEREISVPFSTKEYQSDKENFRAKGSGKSVDLATAKRIALMNAKSEMASLIQTTIKKVTDQYTNQRTIGNASEFSNKFEELAREVTNQTLTNISVIGEKITEKEGSYTYWVAIQANKQEVYDGVNKSVSNNKKLEQDYDKKKFEEIFNSEMDKLAKSKGN
ncbi:MAG: hypothetical protein ACHQK8_06330 [Bacteroidia bacterium]